MVASVMDTEDVAESDRKEGELEKVGRLEMRANYEFRECYWSIGRVVEKKGKGMNRYDPKDKWANWRRRTEARMEAMQKKALKRK